MKRLIFLLLALSVAIQTHGQIWKPVYNPGDTDKQGVYRAGTEIMQFAVHKGKLYAATSYWCESDPVNNPGPCEVICLDAPDAEWQVDFNGFQKESNRISALRSLVFTTDKEGHEIAPDTILFAVPNDTANKFIVYSRDDRTGHWNSDSLIAIPNSNGVCRDIGFYKEPHTNICYVFLAIKNYGIIKGAYDPSAHSRISWFMTPECTTPYGERLIGFTTCNGAFYAATNWENNRTGHIFLRNDSTQSWRCVKSLTTAQIDDIRGFSTVPNNQGEGELIWYTWENRAITLDPLNEFKETVEFSFNEDLSKAIGKRVIATWGPFTANLEWYRDPLTDDSVFYLPIAVMIDTVIAPWTTEIGILSDFIYYERHQKNGKVSYALKIAIRNNPTYIIDLRGARMMCISPFPEDEKKVIYAGGYVLYFDKASKTAWILRGDTRD